MAPSSLRIRVTNEDVIDLYSRVKMGAIVVVLGPDRWRSRRIGQRPLEIRVAVATDRLYPAAAACSPHANDFATCPVCSKTGPMHRNKNKVHSIKPAPTGSATLANTSEIRRYLVSANLNVAGEWDSSCIG
jgi:hypothetical protein